MTRWMLVIQRAETLPAQARRSEVRERTADPIRRIGILTDRKPRRRHRSRSNRRRSQASVGATTGPSHGCLHRSLGPRIFVGGAIALAVGFLRRIYELPGIEFVGMTHGIFRLGNPATAAGLGLQLITYEAQFEKN